MNELYGNNTDKPRSKRRWIYMLAAMIILLCLMAMPGAQTARLSLLIDKNNPPEMILNIPKDCRLEKVYLKADKHVPRNENLLTLTVNDLDFPVANFSALDPIDAAADEGCENRNAPINWDKLRGAKSLKISYKDVNSKLQKNDLELVFEVVGNPDTVKNWRSFVQLYAKPLPGVKKALPAQGKAPVAASEKKQH